MTHYLKSLGILICLILLTPSSAFADTAATGSISGFGMGVFMFNETMMISDGTTEYNFKITNTGGAFNGQCATGGGSPYYAQPCEGTDPTIIDTGGGANEATLRTRFAAAINGTAIGVTATDNGTSVDLVNDTLGEAGNVTITETVANGAFEVTGMSGGTGGVAATPEFSDYLYLTVLALGGYFVYQQTAKKQLV